MYSEDPIVLDTPKRPETPDRELSPIRLEGPARTSTLAQAQEQLSLGSESYDDMSSIAWESEVKLEKPGNLRPTKFAADWIELCWQRVKDQSAVTHYQIRYKDVNQDTRWKILPTEYTSTIAKVSGLKADTCYQFQVRAVYGDDEGPYSLPSEEIHTHQSPATSILQGSTLVKRGEPSLYALPMNEVKKARNAIAKTRMFDIGLSPPGFVEKKIIMLVGATGSGKSTLVDGLVNYVLGVEYNDCFRFSIERLEEEEAKKKGNQAVSMTEWITCYNINPERGGRLKYKLTIIDTPGFGDTRGLERDDQTVAQIRQLFSSKDERGVDCLDAICFLVKAPDARLTRTQAYIFNAILSLFGKDVKDNIRTLITFADGLDPPVLAAMKESNHPFGRYFTFNNSGLFSSNKKQERSSSLSPIFWEMGTKSFQEFFQDLGKLNPVSLTLTKEVLEERKKQELTIQRLQPQVSAGLAKLASLKQEQKVIQQHDMEIRSNANFIYESAEPLVTKRDLQPGQHTTTCLVCNFTCHEECQLADDNDKRRCWAMDMSGNCTQCPENCVWSEHKNTPFVIEVIIRKVQKTYVKMKQKYEIAAGKKLSTEQLIAKLSNEYDEMEKATLLLMKEVNQSTNRLKEIALRPNPLSMVEHIDLMIMSEKLEQKDGYMERIQELNTCRQKATISDDVKHMVREAQKVDVLKEQQKKKSRLSKAKKAVVDRLKFW